MLLLYTCASLDQILTENVTQSIRNMTQNARGQEKSSHEASFSNKKKIVIFQLLQCRGGHGGFYFFFFLHDRISRALCH